MDDSSAFLNGASEMSAFIRAKDWSATPLGPIADWPQSLRTTISLCLASNFPINIIWGPENTQIYNDGYRVVCGAAHTKALGEAYDVTWSSAWPVVGEPFAQAKSGDTSFLEDQRMFLTRNGYLEETFFTFSLSPIRDETGSIGGLFHPVTETTATMLAERRRCALRDLTKRLATATDLDELAALTVASLSAFEFDLPVLLFYELDPHRGDYRLRASHGIEAGSPGAPERIDGDADVWGGRSIAATSAMRMVDGPGSFFEGSPCGPYAEPPRRAFLLPIGADDDRPAAVLVAGASPRLPLDDDYRGFFELLWAAVSAAFTAVRAREGERRRAEALVTLHGGTVAVQSEVGCGDSFTVTLPFGRSHLPGEQVHAPAETGRGSGQAPGYVEGATRWPPDPSEADAAPAAPPSAPRRAVRRVLLADDNADMRAYVARLLRAQGLEVVTATDGEAALHAARSDPPDLILSDVMMPDLDGFGLLAAIREDPALRDVPFILLSARVSEEARIEGLRAGADDYLTKPFSARELVARVSANLNLVRDRREATLRESEERLRLAVDNADVGFWDVDVVNDVLIWPARTKAMFGISAEAPVTMQDFYDGLHPGDRAATSAAFAAAADPERRALYDVEYRTVGKEDGIVRWVAAKGRGVFDTAGRCLRVAGTAVQITARKEAEEALRELNATLETRVATAIAEREEVQEALRQSQKMEAMGQLTGGVAHDFNNLLTPIVGGLDMLQRKGLGNDREQRLIAGAVQSAERARTLVQRLLAFARRQPLQPIPVDVAALVAGMGDLVSSTTGPQIRIVIEASTDLPAALADPNQLEMAILNLAVNARDAMPDGGTLRISAGTDAVEPGHRSKLRTGKYVRLSVADTGQGMDEATVARAVEPFFSTKGIGKGTGLGLSMVHGLASQLGGGLIIHSRTGLGTEVELWLPVSTEQPEPAKAAREPWLNTSASGTALVVDDEELVRMSTADMLTDLGYAVVEAGSAEDAMLLLDAGEHFDLLVTDHLMPGMSGTDLALAVRATRPGTPVLLVSGYAEAQGIDPSVPRLTKPFRKDELAARIAQLSGE